jgi:hypothetical protein
MMSDERHPIEWALDQLDHPFGNTMGGLKILNLWASAMVESQMAWFNDPRRNGYWGA